jgi:hypothetical protein
MGRTELLELRNTSDQASKLAHLRITDMECLYRRTGQRADPAERRAFYAARAWYGTFTQQLQTAIGDKTRALAEERRSGFERAFVSAARSRLDKATYVELLDLAKELMSNDQSV